MEALAALDELGQRHLAEFARERARNVAAQMTEERRKRGDRMPCVTIEALAILLKLSQQERDGMGLYYAAAIALDLELEPDAQAQEKARYEVAAAKRDTAPLYRDNKPFSIWK
jgi:hypothetical protein